MALIDRCHLKHPFYGSRCIRDWLEDHGYRVNRKKVQRLVRTMDLAAQYPKRNLNLANQAHKVYPYLLRGLVIDRPNQVWATDITYIPMARGFVYLVAIMDWYSRKVLSWRVSNMLDTSFCVDALEEAVEACGAPESYSTPTRAASLPAKSSPACSSDTISASAWMARDGGSIMCLWSACGAA